MSQWVRWLDYLTLNDAEHRASSENTAIAKAFFIICVANFFSKFADLIASPKITMVWLMQAVGAPAFLISLMVPIRESGSMLPQLLLTRFVEKQKLKAKLYQIGTVLQASCLFAMAGIGMSVTGEIAGWLIIVLLGIFSLGRCLCSLVSKVVLGKVIPQTLRGQVTGWSSTIAGFISCAIAAWLIVTSSSQSLQASAILLIIASGSLLLASVVYGFVNESVDKQTDRATDNSINYIDKLSLLKTDHAFARFVLVRALMMSSALVAPYYILLSHQSDSVMGALGSLLLASGLAQLCSSAIWGRFSDQSSRTALMLAGILVASTGAVTVTLYLISPETIQRIWVVPSLYFLLEISHQGVRIARKTYVVDLADEATRVDYVAVSNSLIGILLLVSGVVLGAVSLVLPPIWLIAGLSAVCLLGVLLSRGMLEIQPLKTS